MKKPWNVEIPRFFARTPGRIRTCDLQSRSLTGKGQRSVVHQRLYDLFQILTTILTTNGILYALDAILQPGFCDVIIYLQDHLLVSMAHPLHGQLHVYTGISKHGTE